MFEGGDDGADAAPTIKVDDIVEEDVKKVALNTSMKDLEGKQL